jgi:hypothetical protein
MHPRSDEIVAAARRCVGTRTRPQGRRPGLALDCVGVALAAAEGVGVRTIFTADYALGADNGARLERELEAAGCRRVPEGVQGDLAQLRVRGTDHLAVLTKKGAVHAHFGVGRVVEAPLPRDWTIAACWRLPED